MLLLGGVFEPTVQLAATFAGSSVDERGE